MAIFALNRRDCKLKGVYMHFAFVLTVATFISGSSLGPTYAFHSHTSLRACQTHEAAVLEIEKRLEEANLIGGRPNMGRRMVITKCTKLE